MRYYGLAAAAAGMLIDAAAFVAPVQVGTGVKRRRVIGYAPKPSRECHRLPRNASRADVIAKHRAKMAFKKARR